MPYTFAERQKIHRKAKKILGIKPKQDGSDKYIFVQQCIADMMDEGSASDRDEAHDICVMLYEDLAGIYDDEEY